MTRHSFSICWINLGTLHLGFAEIWFENATTLDHYEYLRICGPSKPLASDTHRIIHGPSNHGYSEWFNYLLIS